MDEQLADETYEQFEERVLNKRAAAMYSLVKAKLQLADAINLNEIIARCNKKQVIHHVHMFYVSNFQLSFSKTGRTEVLHFARPQEKPSS